MPKIDLDFSQKNAPAAPIGAADYFQLILFLFAGNAIEYRDECPNGEYYGENAYHALKRKQKRGRKRFGRPGEFHGVL